MGAEFLDLGFVANFGLRKMGAEFLDLRLVPSFGLRKMGVEFLDFSLVASLRLRKEFALEMLDLRNSFWNEGIQPAHRSGKQVGLVRLRSLQGRGPFVPSSRRCLGNQSAIKFDHFRRHA